MREIAISSLRRAAFAAAFASSVLAAGASAASVCGLCNTEIVLNTDLAGCFLAEYDKLAASTGEVIAVDLTGCEQSRGGLEALPVPGADTLAEPDTQFLLSRVQLDCLKRKLEQPGLVLDPAARIELAASCG